LTDLLGTIDRRALPGRPNRPRKAFSSTRSTPDLSSLPDPAPTSRPRPTSPHPHQNAPSATAPCKGRGESRGRDNVHTLRTRRAISRVVPGQGARLRCHTCHGVRDRVSPHPYGGLLTPNDPAGRRGLVPRGWRDGWGDPPGGRSGSWYPADCGFQSTMMASGLAPPARYVGGLLADASLRARCHNHHTWRVSGAAISAECRACGPAGGSLRPQNPQRFRSGHGQVAGQNVRPPRYLRTDIEDNWTSERI
jgi:hypothetical protein